MNNSNAAKFYGEQQQAQIENAIDPLVLAIDAVVQGFSVSVEHKRAALLCALEFLFVADELNRELRANSPNCLIVGLDTKRN
jgi:hypothetical protein